MRDGYKTLNRLRLFVGLPVLVAVIVFQTIGLRDRGEADSQAQIAAATFLITVVVGMVYLAAMAAPALALKAKLSAQMPASLIFMTRGKSDLQQQLDSLDVPRRNVAERLPSYFVLSTSDLGIEIWSPRDSDSVYGVIAWGNVEAVEIASMRIYGFLEVPCLALQLSSGATGHLSLIPSGRGLGINAAGLQGIELLAKELDARRIQQSV